jgi:inosose dehydratase
MKAVKDHHKLIGACLDTGHLLRMSQLGEKLDPAQQVKVMGDRNFGMHLKDHDNKRKEDVVFGDPTGALDVAAVLKALREVKFRGPISIEYEAHPADPSPDMKKCVAVVRDTAKKLG